MADVRQQLATGRRWAEADTVRAAGTPGGPARIRARAEDSALRAAVLSNMVEAEVIPRLLLSRRAAAPQWLTRRTPSLAEVTDLVGLMLTDAEPDARRFVEQLERSGIGPESLYLDLLAPTARRLGEMWEEDLCSFTDVSIGLLRLQTVLRDLGPLFRNGLEPRAFGPRVLLVPVPGEQHTFGLSMVVEFFRRAGWQVWSGPLEAADLVSLLRREWFDVVGFSTSFVDHLETMASAVRAVRRASVNPASGIMVGGAIFTEHPEFAARVGADATAIDGRQAVIQAQTLLTLLTERR